MEFLKEKCDCYQQLELHFVFLNSHNAGLVWPKVEITSFPKKGYISPATPLKFAICKLV